MTKHKHMVEKDYTLQFYKGDERMRVDIEGEDMFILRDKYDRGLLLHGFDEVEDTITLLTKILEKRKVEQ